MSRRSQFSLAAVLASASLIQASTIDAARAWDNSHKHNPDAAICYVDKLKYTNEGGYTVASLDLYMAEKGVKDLAFTGDWNSKLLGKDIQLNQSFTVNLNDFVTLPDDHADKILKDGMEVWISVNITMGENPSCHKDGHKLVFKKNIGRTIHFKSAGTTKDNNRCEYAESISKQCDGTLP